MNSAYNYGYGNTTRRNDLLKLIAIVTMLIDHIGYIFFPELSILRSIGRIAFPIFAYQIAIGYKNTRSLSNYATRLLAFAMMSYLPYVYFNPEVIPNFIAFNVIFLLLMGLGAIKLWELSQRAWQLFVDNKSAARLIAACMMSTVFIGYVISPELLTIIVRDVQLPFTLATSTIGVSYGSYGLLLIMIFYWFENSAVFGLLAFCLLTLLDTFMSGAYYASNMYNIGDVALRFQAIARAITRQYAYIWQDITTYNGGVATLSGYFFQARAIAGVVLIYLSKGWSIEVKMNKYVAYLFYPIHIVIIMQIYYFFVLR